MEGFLAGRNRPARDQQPRRRMPARLTGAAEVGLAGPARSQVPDEGREVPEMCGWDLCRGRQMLQAVRRKSPRSVTPEDLSDPSLLGAGEHGGAMVAEQHHAGQRPGAWPTAFAEEARFPFREKLRCS